ncbi:MAG: RsmE family RNA methyltransferase [Candidatus Nomurabacteria bacterium]
MKLHRFFVKQPLGEEMEIKEKQLLHQWNNVLKFKTGESLVLFNDEKLLDFVFRIESISKSFVKLKLIESVASLDQKLEKRNLNLCVSLIKKDNLDLILEKCTEIGVLNYIPLISERVEKKNIASFNLERVQKIIIESVEQSGWGNIPTICEPIKLENMFKDFKREGKLSKILICDISEESFTTNNLDIKDDFYLFIGPEGGWTENERKMFKDYDLKIVSFGKNTLRAETAAVVGSFKIIDQK